MVLNAASLPTALSAVRGWPLFIALSLLVHLLLFLLLYLLAPEYLPLGERAIAPLSVQLETASPAAAPAATQPPPVVKKQLEPKPKPQVRQERSEPPAPRESAKPATPAVIPAPYDERDLGTSRRLLDTFPDAGRLPPQPEPRPPEEDEESRLHIESLIRTRFADHFVYPSMAQRHGWQGEVLLSFHIRSDGTLTTIQVERSSGYAILDQAALDSLRAIERIEFAPGITLHHMLKVRMPVIYHLAQG